MLFSSTYHSRLYRRFMSIEPNAYRDIIRFFEAKEEAILQLDEDECFEMMAIYANALFEIGNYRAFLQIVDMAIETSIRLNIVVFQGSDIYHLLLFRKAAACFHTGNCSQAEYILKELIKLKPDDTFSVIFLKKVYREDLKPQVRNFRAVAVFFILTAALVSAVEVLFIRPFYYAYTAQTETVRWLLFALGILSLLSGEAWQFAIAHIRVTKILRHMKRALQSGKEPTYRNN